MKIQIVILGLVLFTSAVSAQKDTVILNQDAIYNRPFLNLGKTKTAVGGYIEGNTNYFVEDGVAEGFGMELRRFNIFLYSTISDRVKFLSEIEFEHGTEEIALETAILDFEINSGLNFRAGILLPQIGIFNANHDSPQWDFVERPLSSTLIIPATLSEVGFGFYGKYYREKSTWSYDVYLTNGLNDGVMLNDEGRVFLPAGKSEKMFAEDNNGTPMVNGRLAWGDIFGSEVGASYYGGVYNTFQMEGLELDKRRFMHVYAIDMKTRYKKFEVKGEIVGGKIDLLPGLNNLYGTKFAGVFVDYSYAFWKQPFRKFEESLLRVALRTEIVDFNTSGEIAGGEAGDEITGLTLGLVLETSPSTLIKANYLRRWVTDVYNNPSVNIGGFQFGVASYF